MAEQLFIDNIELPILKSLNPSLTFSVADISQPDKRKSTYSKTIKIPNSKIASKLFGGLFDVNLIDGSFDVTARADMYYLVDGELIMQGYCQIKTIEVTDNTDIYYNIVLFGNTANLFSKAKGLYLSAIADEPDGGLSIYDHQLVKEAIEQSWDYQILENGIPVPFELGKGYVYPLIDYGYSSDSLLFQVGNLSPAIYVKEYWDRVFAMLGYTYTSNFITSTLFKSLIIPSDPTIYAMTEQNILDRQFSVNTPNFLNTGTTTSQSITTAGNTTNYTINMTNDVVDPSSIYDNVAGEYTVLLGGQYNLNAIIDVDATFIPDLLASNLRVTSEIRGKLRVIKNGSTILDETEFFISPLGYATGSRNTITPPPSIEDTHRQVATTSDASISNGRTQSPSNRYQLNVNGVTLVGGDIITLAYNAELVSFDGTAIFRNALDVLFTGDAYLNISVGGFSNISLNQTVGYGNGFDLNSAIPYKYLITDFLKDIIKMFNLQIEPDKLNTDNFIIEPYDDYFRDTTTNDWSEKHAINKPHTITPVGQQKNLYYTFDYKEDKDYYNETYLNQWQTNYGDREVSAVNDFLKGTYKTEITLSPTPIVGDPNGEIVIPRIIKLDDQNQATPTKFNRRILYYGGLKGNPAGGSLLTPWRLDWSTAPAQQNNYYYPYCGHFDDPFNATLDLNFGLVREVYYDDNISAITVTDNNLYNQYYSNMLEGILDPNGKIFEGYFHLNPIDIYKLSFRDLFYHNNSYWRLMKISNYNPTSNELVKCQFQKAITINQLVATAIIVNGDHLDVDGQGLSVDDGYTTPVKNKSQFEQLDKNSFNNLTTKIQGSSNYVNRTAQNINILGDGNKVYSNTQNINLTNSNDNTVSAGIENITLINTDGKTITESNQTWIDGILIDMNDKTIMTTKNNTILKGYDFNSQNNYIIIEEDFNEVLYIVNQSIGEMIYNPLTSGLSGEISQNRIDFEYDTSTMSDNDKLIIMADVLEVNDTPQQIDKLQIELEQVVRQLKKINK